MLTIFLIISFFVGLTLGSFLNCLIYRLRHKKTILGRSFCPFCKEKIKWHDNIPVLSFIFLRGRCRSCQKKISWQYPLVEMLLGLFFAFSLYWRWPNPSLLLICKDWVIFFGLLFVFIYDLKYSEIEDIIILPTAVLIFIFSLFLGQSYLSLLLAILIAVSFFGFQYLITKGKGIGLGDLRIGVLMGAICGSWSLLLVALFFAYVLGTFVSLPLLLQKKKTMKSMIPLGPFLVIGTFIAYFFGEIIISFYLG
jgi:prepilin signal peptidase PulO-like enzyme (type II secretory pathway)